jgi:hypothetical protein
MFKFLLYLFLFYVIFRFFFGKLFGAIVRPKVNHHTTHYHYYNKEKQEGSVTVDPRTVKDKKDDKNLGEYVDYEEIK